MALYTHSPQGEVLLALQSENPRLTGEVTDFTFSAPVQVTGVSTAGKIRGIPGNGYAGVNTFTYNRINMASLLTGVNLRIYQYSTPNNSVTDLIDTVNFTYGLNLTLLDVGHYAIHPSTNLNTFTVPLLNSHQYIGIWPITFVRGDKQLRDFFPIRTLGRTGDVTPMIKTHTTSFDDMSDELSAIPDGSVMSYDSEPLRLLVLAMAAKTGVEFGVIPGVIPDANPLDLTGYTTKQRQAYTVSDAMPGYLYILELTPSPLSGGYTAPLYLHYGKVQLADIGAAIKTTALSGFAASDVS